MTKPNILKEIPINMSQLNKELENIKKRDKELNFRANKTDEYLKQFVMLSFDKAEEMYKKLESLDIPRFKDLHIHKIIDTMPITIDILKAILQGYAVTINNDNLKKIVDVVSEFSEK